MKSEPREGETQYLTWSEFLTELGVPADARDLSERQMRYGICSEPACQWPIAGWCVACRAKLCLDHLAEHRNLHARERLRADESDRDARDELLAHLVDDGSISAEAAQRERCERCDGSGWMIAEDWESGYHLRWKTQCAQCHGCGVAHLSEQEGGGDGG